MAATKKETEWPELLKIPQVAKVLACSESMVKKLIRSGRLPAVTISPKCIRVRKDDLKAFLETQAAKARGQSCQTT